EGAVVDGLGLRDLAVRPAANHVRGRQPDADRIEHRAAPLLAVVDAAQSHLAGRQAQGRLQFRVLNHSTLLRARSIAADLRRRLCRDVLDVSSDTSARAARSPACISTTLDRALEMGVAAFIEYSRESTSRAPLAGALRISLTLPRTALPGTGSG